MSKANLSNGNQKSLLFFLMFIEFSLTRLGSDLGYLLKVKGFGLKS